MCFRLSIHYILYAVCCCISITAETDRHFAGVNIAYGKPATQGPDTYNYISSGTMINYTADLAVDGDTSGNFWDNSCTHTTGPSSTNAYWTVDLQKAYKITGIIIYNSDDYRNRLKNFIIYGNSTEVIHNSFGSKEYEQREISIPLEEGRSFSSITVQLPANDGHPVDGKHFLTLCEVKIFADVCRYMNITNGEMRPDQTFYEVNTHVLIVCKEGFEPARQNITCSNNQRWTYYKPCSLIYCAYPGKPINGDYLNSQNQKIDSQSSLPYGSVITVKCDLGYRSENTEKRICQYDRTWSGEAPVCTKVQCSYPVDISNGEYQLQNGSKYESGPSYYNTTVHVTCNNGFKVNGNKERTCNANQTWSGVWDKEQAYCVKMQPHTETSKAGLIGGTVSAAGLIISASLVALLIIYRRRKRNLKDQEESLTYTSLRKSQIGPSSSDYADLNVTGLEDGISSKGEMPSGSEHAVYCNTTTEL